jgi:nucleoside 2-deoxyribosyltransferase
MAIKNYSEDNRLDILVLGPMDDKHEQASSTAVIAEALNQLLAEPGFTALLRNNNTKTYETHIPESWDEQEIVKGILSRLDIADLVIVNLTPKEGPGGQPSPNVYYELGLLHSLGMPVILLFQKGTQVPFYVRTNKSYRVTQFNTEEVKEALRGPLVKFLDPGDYTDFTDNRITQFYDGLPIVDISAAVGLATGYYYNFVGRLLREGSFISAYPDRIKHLVIIRPADILNTYEQDKIRLTAVLSGAGLQLKTEKLDAPPGDDKGPAWIDHIDGVVIDLPRTIYPLKISPRILAMQERLDKPARHPSNPAYRNMLLKQASEKLLDKVEQVILYHVNKEREGYRKKLLHFCKMDALPGLLQELGVKKDV